MNYSCPACGSSGFYESHKETILSDNYGGEIQIRIEIRKCDICGFSHEVDDKSRKEAVTKLKKDAVLNIIDYLSENQKSIAGIERALGLPQRTIAKWKNGTSSPSSAAVALFKFIKVFPWLLDVADNDFCYEEGQRIQLKNATDRIIEQIMEEKNFEAFSGNYITIDEEKDSRVITFSNKETTPNDVKKEDEYLAYKEVMEG